jgi:transposase
MLLGMLAAAITRIEEHGCRRIGTGERAIVARLSKAPIAAEAVKRLDGKQGIDARQIKELAPCAPDQRSCSATAPACAPGAQSTNHRRLQTWLREQRAKLSKNSDSTKAINYSLNRWDAFIRFLDDGRLCMSNNAAERELRAVALGRRNCTFAGSDEGGRRAAAIYTLIATAKLNDIDPQAWLADVLARLPDQPAKRIDELLPRNWRPQNVAAEAA